MCSTANDICSIKKGYFFKLLYFALLTDVIFISRHGACLIIAAFDCHLLV